MDLAMQSELFHAFEWLRAEAIKGNRHAENIIKEGDLLDSMKKFGRDEVFFGPVPELSGTVPIVLYFPNDEAADGFKQLCLEALPHLVMRKLP